MTQMLGSGVEWQVISAEALCALFFSSDAPAPDSDPKCNPPSDAWWILFLKPPKV